MSNQHDVSNLKEKHGWPMETPGFLLTKQFEIEEHNVFCIRIPEWVFLPLATGFYDANTANPRALMMIATLELWLFTLFVAMLRICKNTYKPSDFAFVVMLEMLMDSDLRRTNNHRLWIFERASNTQHQLSTIFMKSIESDKRVDGLGQFVDFSQPDRAQGTHIMRSSAAASSAGSGLGNATATGESRRNYDDYYKRINGTPTLAMALDIYLNVNRFSANSQSYVRTDSMAPEFIFNITNAFNLANRNDGPDDSTTRLNINPAQMDFNNYRVVRNNKTYIALPFFKQTFHIPALMFSGGPGVFMSRMFPARQINDKHLAWSSYMMSLIRASRQRMADAEVRKIQEQQARRAARQQAELNGEITASAAQDQSQQDADDAVARLENPRRGTIFMTYTGQDESRVTSIDYEAEAERKRNLDAFYPALATGSVRFHDVPIPMSNQQVEEMTEFIKCAADIYKDDSSLEDFATGLSLFYKTQKKILVAEHVDNPKELHRALANLRMIIFEKFETHCTGPTSDVSEAQCTHNDNYTKKNLGNKHWLLPITDPKLTVIDNAIIWMMEGFTWKDNVATSQFLCVMSYIAIGDRWRREMNLHLNLLYTGGNGLGKSLIIEMTQKNILEKTTKTINGKSGKADAIDGVSTDVVICSDDGNLAALFTNVGGDCDAKSHMTTMRTTRAVLDIIQEVSPDGTKRNVRKQKKLSFIEIRCLMMCTNESLADIENNSNGFVQSAAAVYNRFIAIEVPSYDNNVHNVSLSIAAQSAKDNDMRESEDEFHDINQKFDCLRGWAHKLMSIDHDIFYIEMRTFDIVWGFLMEHLSSQGIKPDHPRIAIQAKLWCRQLVLYDSYLREHCTEQSPSFGKPLTALSLANWVPVCMEHHVFITMSAFYRFFVPPAMESVLDVLNSLMEDSFKAKDGRVEFNGKRRRMWEMSKNKNYTNHQTTWAKMANLTSTVDIAKRALAHANIAADLVAAEAEFGAGAVEPAHDMDDDFDNDSNPDDDRRTKAARAAAAAASAAKRASGPPHLSAAPAAAGAANGLPPGHPQAHLVGPDGFGEEPIDATYVHFNMTFTEFASLAQMKMKAMRSPMQPGTSAIQSALRRLRTTPMMSPRYVFDSMEQTTPTLDDKAPSIIMPALMAIKNNTFQVHYGVLAKTGHFRSALKNAITAYCHRKLLPRKILLAVENTRYPWVLDAMHVAPTKRVMSVANPSYVMHTTSSAYSGIHDRNEGLDSAEKPMNLTFDDSDVDMLGLTSYFKRQMEAGVMTDKDVREYHPMTITKQQNFLAMKKAAETGKCDIKCYPDNWLEECESIEYFKDPAALPNDPRKAAADRYVEKNKIIKSAPFIQSVINVDMESPDGTPLGEAIMQGFLEMKADADDMAKIDIYKYANATADEIRRLVRTHPTAAGGLTLKDYKRSLADRTAELAAKREELLYDFEEMGRIYPTAQQVEHQRRTEQEDADERTASRMRRIRDDKEAERREAIETAQDGEDSSIEGSGAALPSRLTKRRRVAIVDDDGDDTNPLATMADLVDDNYGSEADMMESGGNPLLELDDNYV